MRSTSTAQFRKLMTCPSADMLLLYAETGRLAQSIERHIAAHLADCDFCGAETQLLVHNPPKNRPAKEREMSPIPPALHRLALDLLAIEPVRPFAFFAELAFEREPLTLTDA